MCQTKFLPRPLISFFFDAIDSRPAQSAGRVKKIASNPLKILVRISKNQYFHFGSSKFTLCCLRPSSRTPKTRTTQVLRKYGWNNLFNASYFRCLVGDAHIYFFQCISHFGKIIDFVLEKIEKASNEDVLVENAVSKLCYLQFITIGISTFLREYFQLVEYHLKPSKF